MLTTQPILGNQPLLLATSCSFTVLVIYRYV
jgi:hypothetical protein